MKGKNNLDSVLVNRCENFQRVVDVSAHNVSWEIPKFLHTDYCINVAKIILSYIFQDGVVLPVWNSIPDSEDAISVC